MASAELIGVVFIQVAKSCGPRNQFSLVTEAGLPNGFLLPVPRRAAKPGFILSV